MKEKLLVSCTEFFINGEFQEDCRTWQAKADPYKTWMELQSHSIKAHNDLNKFQQTDHKGGLTSAGTNNFVGIQDAFDNLSQVTEED